MAVDVGLLMRRDTVMFEYEVSARYITNDNAVKGVQDVSTDLVLSKLLSL